MKRLLLMGLLLSTVAWSQTETIESESGIIRLNSRLTYLMAEPNQTFRKD